MAGAPDIGSSPCRQPPVLVKAERLGRAAATANKYGPKAVPSFEADFCNNWKELDMSTTDSQLEAVAANLREHLPVPMMLPLMMKLQLLRLMD